MKITCKKCQAAYSIDDSMLTEQGVGAQCPACGDIQVVKKSTSAKATADGSAAAPAAKPEEMFDAVFEGAFPQESKPPPLPPVPDSPTDQVPLAPAVDLTPQSPQAQPETRCERCGAVMPSSAKATEGSLCRQCRGIQEKDPGLVPTEREWRVQKADGIILGPLTLAEVKQKFQEGEISASDQVARREGEFRLISSWAEFASFFERPGQAFELTFKHPPPSHATRNLIIIIILVLAGGGVGGWYLWQNYGGGGEVEQRGDVLQDALDEFRKEISAPTGTSAESYQMGRKFMLLDDRLSYLQADKAFKAALLLDPKNVEALAGWVQNRALLDRWRGDVSARKLALDLIDYALIENPQNPRLLKAQAFLLFSLGRNKEARESATAALGLVENDPESRLALGASYLESSTEMAVNLIKQALEENPELNVAYRLLGEAHQRLGKFHKALNFYKERLEKDPGEFGALHSAAEIYQEVGQFNRARETYEIILAAAPHRAEALVGLARLHTQIFNRPRRALSALDKGLKDSDGMDPVAKALVLCEKAVAYRVQGNYSKALQAVEEALKLDPISIPAMYNRALIEQDSGKLKPALQHLKELQAHLPQVARLRARLAEMLMQIPDFQKATQSLGHAVDLDPRDLDIHLMMAVLHVFLDSPNQAYAWIRKSTELDPFYLESHRAPQVYFDGQTMMVDTAKRALQASNKYEDDPLILSLNGMVNLRAGKPEQARLKLAKALQLDPECFAANLFMGILYLTQSRAQAALGYLQEARKGNSRHAMTVILQGRALLMQGRLKQAQKAFGDALVIAPGDLRAQLGLAEVYAKRKMRAKAVKALLKVYSGDADNLWAKKLLFRLGH